MSEGTPTGLTDPVVRIYLVSGTHVVLRDVDSVALVDRLVELGSVDVVGDGGHRVTVFAHAVAMVEGGRE